MAEFTWKARIAGKSCIIRCEVDGNYYVLYADDERVGSFQRKQGQNRSGGMDEPVTIWGEECRLVVWNEQPDIVVRGRLLGEKKDYEQEKKARQKSFFFTGLAMTALGAVLFVVCMILSYALPDHDNTSLLFGGVLLLAYGLYLMRKWKSAVEKKNDVQ